MAETIIKAQNIDARAMAAKLSKHEADRLIADFQPFLHSSAARYCSKADSSQQDELFSVVMLAFYEAIQSYDDSRGHFFPYARRVLHGRAVDHLRKYYRNRERTMPLDDSDDQQAPAQNSTVAKLSSEAHQAEVEHSTLVEEIEQFEAELLTWGITLDELARRSPKHKQLRESLKAAIDVIAQAPDIMQTIHLKRYLPIKACVEITGLPQKKLERARTYIIATLIIKTGDYTMLSEYVK